MPPKISQSSSRVSLLHRFFVHTWYKKRWWAWLLLPLSWIFTVLAAIHRRQVKKRAVNLSVPVVVVGNITVGGTGKTPLIIALVKALEARGLKVGVISRGYGASAPYYPYAVTADDTAREVGDEPLLMAQSLQCPVVIGRRRVAAGQHLLEKYPNTHLILSDDGLQHYRLARTMEIVVVDGERGLGNHFCLPAGPLREPASRLAGVDWILRNHSSSASLPESSVSTTEAAAGTLLEIGLRAVAWRHVATQERLPLLPLPWDGNHQPVVAVAGIGHPQRFFSTLAQLPVVTKTALAFDDHYTFTENDFSCWKDNIVLMTEKDAVKCHALAHQQCWALVVEMSVPDILIDSITALHS